MRRWLVGLALACGLAAGLEAQPLTGGLLGRPTADYAYIPAPSDCAATNVLFFGTPVTVGPKCDAGLTYDAATDILTVGVLNAGTALTTAGIGLNAGSAVAMGLSASGAAAILRGEPLYLQGAGGSPSFLTLASAGTTEHTGVVRGSKATALTDASATPFASFTIADGADYAGEITYKIRALKGTALQTLKGRVQFSATREGSTYTVSVSEMGTQTLAAAAGTLTGAISIAGAAGVVTLSANFDTSQASPDSFTLSGRFDSTDAAIAVTWIP